MIVESLSNYLQFDVTTKIRQIFPYEIEFPPVIICNENIFATPIASEYINPKKFNLSKYLINASDEEIRRFQPSSRIIDPYWLSYLSPHPKFNKTLLRKFSYWPDYLLDCKFGSIKRNCNEIMSYKYHPTYKNCFSFNAPELIAKHDFKPETISRKNEGFEISKTRQDTINTEDAQDLRKLDYEYTRKKCIQLKEDRLFITKSNCSNALSLYVNVNTSICSNVKSMKYTKDLVSSCTSTHVSIEFL